MGFTAAGQIRQEFIEDRDRRSDVSTPQLCQSRADIPDLDPAPWSYNRVRHRLAQPLLSLGLPPQGGG